MNIAIVLIGSNLHPQDNIKDCLHLLIDQVIVVARSRIWKTKSYGREGPDFLNLAIRIRTDLNKNQLKESILQKIENESKRGLAFVKKIWEKAC